MLKNIRKRMKNEKGLTLVELLAVIVILGIIAAIAVPAIGNVIDNSRYNSVKADAINVLNAAEIYFLDNPEAEQVAVNDLGVTGGYLESLGSFEGGAATNRVVKGNPNKLIAGGIEYTKGKTVDFNNVSIDDINKDTQKGSDSGNAKSINPQ